MLCPVDLSGSLKAIVEHPICILKPVMIVEYHCYQDASVLSAEAARVAT